MCWGNTRIKIDIALINSKSNNSLTSFECTKDSTVFEKKHLQNITVLFLFCINFRKQLYQICICFGCGLHRKYSEARDLK